MQLKVNAAFEIVRIIREEYIHKESFEDRGQIIFDVISHDRSLDESQLEPRVLALARHTHIMGIIMSYH